MVQIYSETQNEPDSGIEDSPEKASDHVDKQLEVRGGYGASYEDDSDLQLELRKNYDYAVQAGIDAAPNYENEEAVVERRSETSETSNDEGLQSLSSYVGDAYLVKANVPGLTEQPMTIINHISDCGEFSTGIKYEVTNNVTVKVEPRGDQNPDSEKANELSRKKLGDITKVIAAIVMSTLILVIIVVVIVVVQVTQTASHSPSKPTSPGKPELPIDDTYDTLDQTGPGNLSWVSRATCGLQNPNKYSKFDKMTLPVDMIFVGHTVTPECSSVDQCCPRVSSVQAYQLQHLADIGYHFLVGSDGNVYQGRSWNYTGAHTRGANCKYGVAFIGNFMTKPPVEKQVDAAFRLFEALVSAELLKPNYTIAGQNDVRSSPTESPGKMLIQAMADWPHYRKEDQVTERFCR